jgi:hypothetical protein
MWEPRRLPILWATIAYPTDNVIFIYVTVEKARVVKFLAAKFCPEGTDVYI